MPLCAMKNPNRATEHLQSRVPSSKPTNDREMSPILWFLQAKTANSSGYSHKRTHIPFVPSQMNAAHKRTRTPPPSQRNTNSHWHTNFPITKNRRKDRRGLGTHASGQILTRNGTSTMGWTHLFTCCNCELNMNRKCELVRIEWVPFFCELVRIEMRIGANRKCELA